MDVSMNKPLAFLSKPTSLVVLVPVCIAFFLLIVALGNPPQALGLDPAWTEVQAWGFLHHVQWGRDLINTYGPLGFLHPLSSYVSGIFTPFVIGQIALPAAFAFVIALMFHRAGLAEFGLFALAYLCCFFKLPGDISWILTLLVATTYLINRVEAQAGTGGCLAIFFLAPLFATIALTKFTLFPIWALCVATVTVGCMLQRDWRRALLMLAVFIVAFVAVWWACGQKMLNLPRYLSSGFEMATGYKHATSVPAPAGAEAAGLTVLFLFAGASVHAAWHARSNLAAVISIGLTPLAALFLWLAYFTRADDYHWPGFFAAMSLLPFMLLRNRHVVRSRALLASLVAVVLVSVLAGFTQAPPVAVLRQVANRVGSNLHDLTHLPELHTQREAQWQAVSNSAALPAIRDRVGGARIDMVTWQQGMILVNGLNYAPRPVFQSHLAATPKLARLNETYFLGPKAPEFVLFQLNGIDNRVPMSEDGVALMALLRRYRPVLSEDGFLLLQRDDSVATAGAIVPNAPTAPESIGVDVAIPATTAPTVAFVDAELSWPGKLYTLLFAEPALGITLRTSDAEPLHHRFIRLSAPSGFLIDPVIESTHDWLKLYFSKPLAQARSFRIDTESPWQRTLFQSDFKVSWRSLDILHADSSTGSAELRRALYPGFDLEPVAPSDLRVILEDAKQAIFLHAPASLLFEPAPGHYRISAAFGIQNLALAATECADAKADGVGVSVLLHHAGRESVVWHSDIDPFHREQDRGLQRLRVQNVNVEAGDQVEYRVDAGPSGSNTSCDWSYVRDVAFSRGGILSADVDRRERIFNDDFE
jgi:hypothetical protein